MYLGMVCVFFMAFVAVGTLFSGSCSMSGVWLGENVPRDESNHVVVWNGMRTIQYIGFWRYWVWSVECH